jgi:serine/threonine protein phosphatase PrpC
MGSTTTYVMHNDSLISYQNKALPLKLDEMNSSFTFDINSGDIIFLLSDGITDFVNQKEFESLIDVSLSPDILCNKIIEYIKTKEKSKLKDDLSLIVIKSI